MNWKRIAISVPIILAGFLLKFPYTPTEKDVEMGILRHTFIECFTLAILGMMTLAYCATIGFTAVVIFCFVATMCKNAFSFLSKLYRGELFISSYVKRACDFLSSTLIDWSFSIQDFAGGINDEEHNTTNQQTPEKEN